ncbi:hypothetical protein EIP91_001950 [Steccherinum ochraceum]|uniref:F-box domain-containing protein n=1 Tax=Steccherinum ochraceum TaxID=92696 RepID=A0A4R0RQ73_9APHY|nr:hypothetical protein EIP91_001950 [Steccherinum ochraceum]
MDVLPPNGLAENIKINDILEQRYARPVLPEELLEEILVAAWTATSPSLVWLTPISRWLFYGRILQTFVDFQAYEQLRLRWLDCALTYRHLRIRSDDMFAAYLMAFHLRPFMTHCMHLDINFPRYTTYANRDFWFICDLLRGNTGLRSVSIHCSRLYSRGSIAEDPLGPPTLPSVTTLQVTSNIHALDCVDELVSAEGIADAFKPFPNATLLCTNLLSRHVGYESQYLPSLSTLVLDLPPKSSATAVLTPSVVDWEIALPLKRRRLRIRRIVVQTGPLSPVGWSHVQAACDEAAVELVHEVKYARSLTQYCGKYPFVLLVLR